MVHSLSSITVYHIWFSSVSFRCFRFCFFLVLLSFAIFSCIVFNRVGCLGYHCMRYLVDWKKKLKLMEERVVVIQCIIITLCVNLVVDIATWYTGFPNTGGSHCICSVVQLNILSLLTLYLLGSLAQYSKLTYIVSVRQFS